MPNKYKFAEHIKFPTQTTDFSADLPKIEFKILAQVMDICDKVIYDAVVDFAKEAGISDLYLLDREFVRTALINEAERRAKEEVEKPLSDDDFEARDLLQDILEEEKLERHIEEMLMDAIEEGADNA